jgi:hypothetical protein
MIARNNKYRVVVASVLASLALRSEQITRDVHEAWIVDRAALVPPASFSEDVVENMGKRLMEERPNFKLLRLTVGTDGAELAASLGTAAIDVPAYDYVVASIQRNGIPAHPLARLVATQSGALLTMSDKGGIRERLLLGRDPTRTIAGNAIYRLLHFQLQSPPQHATGTVLGYALTMYFSTDPTLSVNSVQALAKAVKSALGFDEIYIHVRNDAWFFSQTYPHVFRFAKLPPLPTKEQYNSTPSVSCAFVNTHLDCRGNELSGK